MSTLRRGSDWELAHVLGESTRRRIFEAVRTAAGPVTRDDVAVSAQVNRRLAAFHLERLAASGLVTVDYARPDDRKPGPGAGRPSKRYQATAIQLDLTLPRRSYDLAARILARGITANPGAALEGVLQAAHAEGVTHGAHLVRQSETSVAGRTSRLCEGLAAVGYEPRTDNGRVRLGNCPFRSAADIAPGLVCGMNRAFIEGFVEGCRIQPAEVVLDPQPAPNCCVTVACQSG